MLKAADVIAVIVSAATVSCPTCPVRCVHHSRIAIMIAKTALDFRNGLMITSKGEGPGLKSFRRQSGLRFTQRLLHRLHSALRLYLHLCLRHCWRRRAETRLATQERSDLENTEESAGLAATANAESSLMVNRRKCSGVLFKIVKKILVYRFLPTILALKQRFIEASSGKIGRPTRAEPVSGRA